MYQGLPSTCQEALGEHYFESQQVISTLDRQNQIRDQISKLERAKNTAYHGILNMIISHSKLKERRLETKSAVFVYYKDRRSYEKNGRIPESSFNNAISTSEKLGMPIILLVGNEEKNYQAAIKDCIKPKYEKLLKSLDGIISEIEDQEAEREKVEIETDEIKTLLSELDKGYINLKTCHETIGQNLEEAMRNKSILQKKHQRERIRYGSNIEKLTKSGISFDLFKDLFWSYPQGLDYISSVRPGIKDCLTDEDFIRFVELDTNLNRLNQKVAELSRASNEVDRELYTMQSLNLRLKQKVQ